LTADGALQLGLMSAVRSSRERHAAAAALLVMWVQQQCSRGGFAASSVVIRASERASALNIKPSATAPHARPPFEVGDHAVLPPSER